MILTNRHIIDQECSYILIVDVAGKKSLGSVLAKSEKDDLAIIQSNRQRSHYIRLRMNETYTHALLPKMEESVHVVGFPEGEFQPRGGLVDSLQDPKHSTRGFSIGLGSTLGGSGSPVFDPNGLFIGLLWGGTQYRKSGVLHIKAYALSAIAIIPFLIHNQVGIGTSSITDSKYRMQPDENYIYTAGKIERIARAVVVQIFCCQ